MLLLCYNLCNLCVLLFPALFKQTIGRPIAVMLNEVIYLRDRDRNRYGNAGLQIKSRPTLRLDTSREFAVETQTEAEIKNFRSPDQSRARFTKHLTIYHKIILSLS